MFCDLAQRLLDILELVLDPAHVLFVNGTKAVPLQTGHRRRRGIPVVVSTGI
jgi:hypothetical protein